MRGLQGCRLFTLAVMVLVAASTTAFAQFSALYKFGTNNGDPCDATNSGIVAQGRDGNLYSTAPWCGAYGYGAVFKITPAGALTVLYSFGGKNGDGLNPRGGLTLGTDGNFYGTTAYGGTNLYGTVFKITFERETDYTLQFLERQRRWSPLCSTSSECRWKLLWDDMSVRWAERPRHDL